MHDVYAAPKSNRIGRYELQEHKQSAGWLRIKKAKFHLEAFWRGTDVKSSSCLVRQMDTACRQYLSGLRYPF
jgi:hypothetical protein